MIMMMGIIINDHILGKNMQQINSSCMSFMYEHSYIINLDLSKRRRCCWNFSLELIENNRIRIND